MKRIRYATPARPQGELRMRRATAELVGEDVRMRAFVYSTDHGAGGFSRKRLVQRPDGFHCDPQVMRMPRFTGPARIGTHAVPNDAPPLRAEAEAKAIVEATGPNPRLSACGRPPCSDDADGVIDAEGV